MASLVVLDGTLILYVVKEVQVSDHVIDWIRVFARAFFSGFQNAASNDQRLHNIFCWYKMADGADESVLKDYPLMSNKYKIHSQFNLVAYESVSIVLRSG